jgi:hypothetical protein
VTRLIGVDDLPKLRAESLRRVEFAVVSLQAVASQESLKTAWVGLIE